MSKKSLRYLVIACVCFCILGGALAAPIYALGATAAPVVEPPMAPADSTSNSFTISVSDSDTVEVEFSASAQDNQVLVVCAHGSDGITQFVATVPVVANASSVEFTLSDYDSSNEYYLTLADADGDYADLDYQFADDSVSAILPDGILTLSKATITEPESTPSDFSASNVEVYIGKNKDTADNSDVSFGQTDIFVRTGDVLWIKIIASNISDISSFNAQLEIEGASLVEYSKVETADSVEYIAYIELTSDVLVNLANDDNLSFSFLVEADNEQVVLDNATEDIFETIFYDGIKVIHSEMASSNVDSSVVQDGDNIIISLVLNDTFPAEVSINSVPLTTVSSNWDASTNTLTLTYNMDNTGDAFGLETGDLLDIKVELTDGTDSVVVTLTEELVYDSGVAPGPGQLNNVSLKLFYDQDAETQIAVNGDRLILTFIPSITLRNANIYIAGELVASRSILYKNRTYSFYYTLNGTEGLDDNSLIPFKVEGRVFPYGPQFVYEGPQTGANEKVTYYAPLEYTTFAATTANQLDASTYVAANGQQVTVQFTTGHPVIVSQAKIAGITATDEIDTPTIQSANDDGMNWTITFTLPDDADQQLAALTDNEVIPIEVVISDAKGQGPVTALLSEASSGPAVTTSKAVYFAPIEFDEIAMIAEDGIRTRTDVAKNGDTITVTFTTSHYVTITNGSMASQTIAGFTSSNSGGMTWSTSFTLDADVLQDQQYIPIRFTATDAAGQEATYDSVTEQLEDVLYYAPIVIDNISLVSDNAKDPMLYAKDGDTITVSFGANHEILITEKTIAGGAASENSSVDSVTNKKTWLVLGTLQNGQIPDQQYVHFSVSVSDVAGNTPVVITQANVNPGIQYFAPIEAVTSIISNNKNTGYAKNGDTVTVYATLNHKAQILSGSIGGRGASNTQYQSANIAMQYGIPLGEATLGEGELSFTYTAEDPAGNTLTVNTVSANVEHIKVIYDRTPPEAAFSPLFNGFTNQDTSLSIVFTDKNLDGSGISVRVNEAERAGNVGDLRGRETYTYTISFTEENEYRLTISATDLAGNEMTRQINAFVVVDKTSPVIRLFDSATRTYKGGFTLDEIFNIDETYVKEVICSLTDNEGVHEWSLSEPITKDGKKTVNIIVVDMAGNCSVAMTYDFYIDSTAPMPMISELSTMLELMTENNNLLRGNEIQINATLENLHVGDELPDKYVELKLVDSTGAVVVDLLEECATEEGAYLVSLSQKGEYKLIVNAVDDVGNETGQLTYEIHFRNKNIFERWYENTPLFYGSLAAILAVGAALFVRRRKSSKN